MYEDKVNHYAQVWGVDPQFAHSIIRTESNYNPNAVSPTGARGMGQLTGPIIRAYGVTDPFDPDQNLNASMRLLSENLQRRNGNKAAAAADYNGGIRQGDLVMAGRSPDKPETFNYTGKVMGQTNFPRTTGYMANDNMDPTQVALATSGGDVKSFALPVAIAEKYKATRENRAKNLPLALGAMLSGDKGIANFGNALFEDANAAQNPNKLSPNMTLMPDGTVIATGDAQSDYYKYLKARDMEINQNNYAENQAQIDAAKASGIHTPWANAREREKMLPAASASANAKLTELNQYEGDLKSKQQNLDRFGELNRNNSSGSLYDKLAPDWAHFGSDKQQMIQIQNKLATDIPKGQGAISNYERSLFKTANVNIGNDGNANAAIRQANETLLKISHEKREMYQQFYDKHGFINADADTMINNEIDRRYGAASGSGPISGASSGTVAPNWKVEKH